MRRHALPDQMTRVKINTELRTVGKYLKNSLRRIIVKRDFSGMDLQRKPDSILTKYIENRSPKIINLLIAVPNHFFCRLRKRIKPFPNGGSRESRYDMRADVFRGNG